MKLEELKRLNKQKNTKTRLNSTKRNIQEEITQLTYTLKTIEEEIEDLKDDNRQAVIDYYVGNIIREAIQEHKLPSNIREFKSYTNWTDGKIAVYSDGSDSAWDIIVDNDLNIIKIGSFTNYTIR